MKKILLIFLLVNGHVFAGLKKAEEYYNKRDKIKNSNLLIFQELFKSKYFFSSVPFAAEHIIQSPSIDQNFEDMLEILVLKTGTTTLTGIDSSDLAKHKTPSTSLILGLKLFNEDKYTQAIEALAHVPTGPRFSPDAALIRGSSYNLLSSYSNAVSAYDQCISTSNQFEKESRNL